MWGYVTCRKQVVPTMQIHAWWHTTCTGYNHIHRVPYYREGYGDTLWARQLIIHQQDQLSAYTFMQWCSGPAHDYIYSYLHATADFSQSQTEWNWRCKVNYYVAAYALVCTWYSAIVSHTCGEQTMHSQQKHAQGQTLCEAVKGILSTRK